MMPGHVAFVRLLHRGFAAMVDDPIAGKALFDSYFAYEADDDDIQFWATDADRARWYAHLVETFPKSADGTFRNIERGYPRSTASWPRIHVIIADELDARPSIGNVIGRDRENALNYIGSFEHHNVAVEVYSENLTELEYLKVLAKGIVRGSASWLMTNLGISTLMLRNAGDIEPGKWLPETVFVTQQRWEIGGLQAQVIDLGPPKETLYAHLDAATFTAGSDTLQGKITPEDS